MVNERTSSIVIHTGGDPRNLTEFEAIRQEINKSSHPSQPEVNWKLVESLALTLFRRNGVDLQTATYYTLARTRLAGMAGFTEGCELLAGVISSEWAVCWPDNETARIEILEWFNSRIGNVLRAQILSEKMLPLLFRAERALQIISDTLQQLPLRRLPRIENLLYFIQNSIKQIEQEGMVKNRALVQTTQEAVTLVWMPRDEEAEMPTQSVEQVFESPPVPPKPAAEMASPTAVQLNSPAKARRKLHLGSFFTGALCCSLIAALGFFLYINPLYQRLEALGEQPDVATLLWLEQPVLATYGKQLDSLASQSPLLPLARAERSVALAKQNWPQEPQQQQETLRWQQIQQARTGDAGLGQSYFYVQQHLQTLSNQLLEQERLKGSLTISYLKTAIYQMQSALQADVPLEELLRQLSVSVEQGKPASAVLLKQIDDRWNTLSSRYHQFTQR